MSLRERFPIFQTKAYINSCSYGALSTDVRVAYENYLNDRDRHGSHWEHWVEQLEVLRDSLAKFIETDADEIAITTSLSEGLNALASAMTFDGQRNKIVLTAFDFPTTAQIWRAQEKRGAKIVDVPASEDGKTIPPGFFEENIDEHTLIVSVPHICYRNGAKLDVASIIEIAHRHGALVFLDCYQSIGTTLIDAKQLNADFIAGGMLKYLLSSAGTGFLYVKHDLIQDLLPTNSGWFSQTNVHAMDNYHNDPAPSARRYESGTPGVPGIYAAIAGLDLIREIGLNEIEKQVKVLTSIIKGKAIENGFELAMPEDENAHGPLVTLKTNDMHRLVRLLEEDHIVTSCRDNNLRISPHFYNNMDDVERLFECLGKYRKLMV